MNRQERQQLQDKLSAIVDVLGHAAIASICVIPLIWVGATLRANPDSFFKEGETIGSLCLFIPLIGVFAGGAVVESLATVRTAMSLIRKRA